MRGANGEAMRAAAGTRRRGARAWLVTFCVLAACAKAGEPVKITSVTLGSHLNDDKTVTASSETFSPPDTVYGSVTTEGVGKATLAAQWVGADGQVLAQQTQEIDPTTAARFEFHFAPPGGWPVGRPKVVFTLNGGGARTREFQVR